MSVTICVCVKVVPREAIRPRIDPVDFRLDRTGPSEINANDEHAVEEALRLRDDLGGEVVVISMGPTDGAESLRPVLAMGADRVVLIADPALEGSDVVASSRVLASALKAESPDLVIFGAQASDGAGAMLWAAVAEHLGQPVLTGVRRVDLSDGLARASRHSAAQVLHLEASLPCVVSLSGAVNDPRHPSFREVVAAKRKQIEVRTTTDLGIAPHEIGAAGSRTTVVSLRDAPSRRRSGEVVDDDGSAARWLFGFLSERGLA